VTFRITITPPGIGQLVGSQFLALAERLNRAITAAMNMTASLILAKGQADIAGAGNFGSRWTSGLKVNVEGAAPNMRLFMTHEIPWAGIFETGGIINGSPLLWIPLSGTDAAGTRASAFGGLFSARYPRKSGPPLLFSMADKKPRYFGVEQITIPKKFQLTEDITSVMSNFRSIFDEAWQRG
jgi:hypothetical protein